MDYQEKLCNRERSWDEFSSDTDDDYVPDGNDESVFERIPATTLNCIVKNEI